MLPNILQQSTLKKQRFNFFRCALFHMETTVSLRYFVSYSLWKLYFDSKSPHTHSNLIALTFLVILWPFTLF